MDKKVLKFLFNIINKDIDIASLKATSEETKNIITELKKNVTDDFKNLVEMIGDSTAQ